jgi:hypothetical protein
MKLILAIVKDSENSEVNPLGQIVSGVDMQLSDSDLKLTREQLFERYFTLALAHLGIGK